MKKKSGSIKTALIIFAAIAATVISVWLTLLILGSDLPTWVKYLLLIK